MSGAGRRTCYRKGVTAQVLYGDPEPKENECIVKVVERRGNNLFEVIDAENNKSLTMMPTKFKKLIWIKRGNFLIVSKGNAKESSTSSSNGKKKNQKTNAVTSIVEHILYKDQIKSLKQKNMWPSAFDSDDSGLKEPEAEKEDVVIVTCEDAEGNEILSSELLKEMDKKLTVEPKQDDGICMMPLYNPSFFVNRNRHGGCVSEEEDEESDDE